LSGEGFLDSIVILVDLQDLLKHYDFRSLPTKLLVTEFFQLFYVDDWDSCIQKVLIHVLEWIRS